jgi:hypothetical protein
MYLTFQVGLSATVDHDSFRTLLDQIILHTMILKDKKKS